MSSTCLVTGAGGFVGQALLHALVDEGNEVRGLDVTFPADWPAGVQQLRGDICDSELLQQGCRGAGTVFHLAALLPQRRASVSAMRHVNVEGLRCVLEAARRAGAGRVVVLSSAEVYGVPRTVPCPEEAPLRPLGEYGRNKVEAEGLARDAACRGLDAVILRPPAIVGPGMTDRVLLGALATLRKGWPVVVPSGSGRFQMLALSDLVSGCLAAARANGVAGEAFNLGSDPVPPQRETFRQLRDLVASHSPIVPLPRVLLRGLLRALTAIGRSPLEPEHIPIALADYVLDIRKARERLGWAPAKANVEALAEAYRCLASTGTTLQGS